MAVGRQDYQGGVVPIKSGYSLAQTPYFDSENKSITTLGTKDFCSYTVPAGYQLNICGYRVTASFPFIHVFTILVDDTAVIYRVFEFELNDNFPELATLVINAGETFKIVVINKDEITQLFYTLVFGYLEQIET